MDPVQRQATVMWSSLLGEAVPFDFLVAAANDADDEVRKLVCVAYEGLARWANPSELIPLLADRDSQVRGYAEQALIPYGNRVPLEPVLQALMMRGVDFEDPLAQVLGTFGERFPRDVLEDLVTSHAEVAAVILGELGTAAPIELLDAILAVPLSQRTRSARFEALLAAKRLKNPQLAPRLAAIMRDQRDESRFAAAAALGALGDPLHLPEILALLPLATSLNLSDVAEGLAAFGERMPVDAMVAFILAAPADSEEDMIDVIDALRFAGTRTPYSFLVSYLQDTDREPWARGIAAHVLAAFVGAGLATVEEYEAACQVLVGALRAEGDPLFRHYAALSLGFIKDTVMLEPLSAVVSATNEDGFVAIGAAQGLCMLAIAGLQAPLEMWKWALDHSSDARRKSAILALGAREDAPTALLLDYFADSHLKALVHMQVLRHPPANAPDLARQHLALLAQENDDPLGPAARTALARLEGASS